jgi:hypothetical protein
MMNAKQYQGLQIEGSIASEAGTGIPSGKIFIPPGKIYRPVGSTESHLEDKSSKIGDKRRYQAEITRFGGLARRLRHIIQM